MKLDMHCHVREGSIDSRVTLEYYITELKKRGIDGMLITDHDTYKGYRHWKSHMKDQVHEDFVVLKGIEYDTGDGGHRGGALRHRHSQHHHGEPFHE